MEWLLVAVLVVAVVWVVSAPLRRGATPERDEGAPSAARAELEAAKEAKYREIRDAEMDYRTGKLSESDWRSLDRALRGEAIELLRKIDELP